jgi:1,4-dihydroxy-2-naphthoate octaprenyltransferase
MKHWLHAFRLRTLPLAAASVLTGSMLAGIFGEADGLIFFLCLLVAFELQILSNLANDYGDFVKGTDNQNRLGNQRALQSGALQPKQVKRMMVVFVAAALLTGVGLLLLAFPEVNLATFILLATGIAAIGAAIKYTVGNNAYGYKGWGDIFVFLFFGIFAVLGTSYVQYHVFIPEMILPAITIGLFATAVLNVNNIRDIDNDKACGKITIPVRLGVTKAKQYHVILIAGATLSIVAFSVIIYQSAVDFLYLLSFPVIFANTRSVWTTEPSPAYNKLLKQLSLSILFFALMTCVSYILSFIVVVTGIGNVFN